MKMVRRVAGYYNVYTIKKTSGQHIHLRNNVNGSTPGDVVDLFAGAGLKNVSVNNLEKLREFENKNTSLPYKVANNPSLFMALGEK